MSNQPVAVPVLVKCTAVKRKVVMPQHGGINTFTAREIPKIIQ